MWEAMCRGCKIIIRKGSMQFKLFVFLFRAVCHEFDILPFAGGAGRIRRGTLGLFRSERE